jgi:small subunit ribosomal protein S1
MAEDQQKDVQGQEEAAATAPAEATPETTSEDTGAAAVKEEAQAEEAAPEAAPEEETAEPVAEETPAEEPVAEVEAEPVTEEAVEEAEPVAEAEAEEEEEEEESVEPETTSGPSISKEDALMHAKGMIGYTGEISGEVFKLEDLDKITDPDDANMGLDELRKLVENTLTNVSENEIVAGRVISVGEKDVVIDIGFKSDGIVSRSEFDSELAAGQEVEVFLERIEDYHGQLVLSKTKADTVRRWRRIEEAFEREEVLEGQIVRRIKGGMIVELFGSMEAFLPGSQIDVRPVRDFDAYLEKRMEFKIVKLNPANENIVVSHKALIEKDLMAQREKILSTMEPGQILEGVVKNITDFGVFIDLGGVDGLLHITDLSWGRVSHPSELVSLDQKLNVVVLDYDKERQRISLGLKQLQKHPWEDIQEKLASNQVVEGKVVSITDYGAFVELEKGIEGLVHISEMSWTEHIRHPSQMVSLGQMVQVKILNVDSEGKKISLGMKQLEPDPWDNIAERYPAGTVMRGKVRNITNFGVFVEMEPGIDGLVHISDLSWTKRIKHPSDMVKKGQELDVVVLNIDTAERRISLGHKQVDVNPWNQFATVYAEGSTSSAKVVRAEDKGLVVELPLEVEAFIPEGELPSGKTVSDFRAGDEIQDLFVIRFDANQKEIVLSATEQARNQERAERAAEKRQKNDERREEQRSVQQFIEREQSSGPATLGELSGLAELKAQMEQTEAAAAAEAAPKKASKAKAAKAEEAEEAGDDAGEEAGEEE